ncbi:hypothetical protein P3W54_14030 [Achromobacter anxifer]|nr:hypothetical protein [Achromobacter anxifer]
MLAVLFLELLGRPHRSIKLARHGPRGRCSGLHLLRQAGHALLSCRQFSARALQASGDFPEPADFTLRSVQRLELAAQVRHALGRRRGRSLDLVERPGKLVLQGRDDAQL